MENKNQNYILISQLAYSCHQAKQNNDTKLLEELTSKLQVEMSNIPIKEQYDYMAKLQNPNNVNGALPAVEYSFVRDGFMKNLTDYYSANVVFVDVFASQVDSFSFDQLTALKLALQQEKSNRFPANTDLNQNGINNQSRRFNEYVDTIDILIDKCKEDDFVDGM